MAPRQTIYGHCHCSPSHRRISHSSRYRNHLSISRAWLGRRLSPVLLASVSLVIWGSLAPLPARANGMGEVVRSICMRVFKAEMQDAGKTAPAGMANYTCSCVSEQITSGSTIDGAKATCKQQASLRYPL
jgi:hypothetical protein